VAREYIDGTEAIVRGALHAGCDFFAGYPITPSSGVLVRMMRELPKIGGMAVQGEDEIASIGMCIAASMAGRRVLTATSGPGISLYSENLGLAIMGEVPLVIINVQRLGPATGGATTGAEGDVQFVQWVTSGGLPMVVLSPTDVATSYWLTTVAFRLAEKLRIPVILNTSKDLVQTMETVDVAAWRKVAVEPRTSYQGGAPYVPYRFAGLGDVPEFLPVGADFQVRFTTSMHDEHGNLTKKPAKVDRTFRHFQEKVLAARDELVMVDRDLQEGATTLVVASGVSARSSRAAVGRVRAGGGKVSMLTAYSVWPVPEQAIREAAVGMKRVVVPEMNLGLYRREIERLLPGLEVVGVNRVDGEVLTPDEIVRIGRLEGGAA
jgi:2-oxoglutarate ferredoxin oxidoreductase subunit alpha